MVAQEGADPVAGEEDVAGALDVEEGVEGGADVTDGVALAGGMVEPAEQRGGPRLDAAILGDEQGAEEGVEGGRVGRHGAGDEVEAADAVGVRQAGALGADDRVAAVGQAYGERVGEIGVIRLVEERLGAVAPDGVEASEGGGRGGAVDQHAEEALPGRSLRMAGAEAQQTLLRAFAEGAREGAEGRGDVRRDGGEEERVCLRAEALHEGVEPKGVGDEAGLIILVQKHEAGQARGLVGRFVPMGEEPVAAGGVGDEQAVGAAVGVGQDALGGEGQGEAYEAVAQVDFEGSVRLPLGGKGDGEALRADDAGCVAIFLTDLERLAAWREADDGHAFTVHPGVVEGDEILGRVAVKDVDQVVPRGVVVGIRAEVFADALAEGVFAHELDDFAHHYGGFVVDDLPVDEAGVAEVVQLLVDGVRARGTVLRKGGGEEGAQALQLMVDTGEEWLGDPGREVVGEDLLRPHVVEPIHRDEVAEPRVGCLVRDELDASQLLVGRRVGAEEELRVII